MIDLKILALLSPNGFDERFWKNSKDSKTYMEAYEKTEIEHEKHFVQFSTRPKKEFSNRHLLQNALHLHHENAYFLMFLKLRISII